jgi:hypothetical protein
MDHAEIQDVAGAFLRQLALNPDLRTQLAAIFAERDEALADEKTASLVSETLQLRAPFTVADMGAFKQAVKQIHQEMPPESYDLFNQSTGYSSHPIE